MASEIFLTLLLSLIPIFFFLARKRWSKRLPPGSLGIPIIGQSLSLLRAMRMNYAEQWLQERVRKYGPISKLNLFGNPTVFISGQAANKFLFTSDSNILNNQQTQSFRKIMGDRNLSELSGDDHKRVRDALVSFLKPESLKQYVGKMDEEIRRHIKMHWQGKETVTVMPLMKNLTFNIICSLLFGLEHGAQRDKLVKDFQHMTEGIWSVPINFPFTRYNRSLQASTKVQNMLMDLVHERRAALEANRASPHQDLVTCLLSIRSHDNRQVISDEEILHNVILVMVAGHDTSSILITLMVQLLANDASVYASVSAEQEEIAKSNSSAELLTWDDLTKMKHTWRVALETPRLIPPAFGGFRKASKDIEYGGYLIPKGWQIFWAANMTRMDDSIFHEPSKFDPMRFANQALIPPYCFVAFGGGPRICPGYDFARIETLIAIHYLVTRFNWKLCCKDTSISRDPMPKPKEGLPIQLESKKTRAVSRAGCK